MADYRPITPASENKLSKLWDTLTKTQIPLGSAEYGLGVDVNDVMSRVLAPFSDNRAPAPERPLPESFSLEDVAKIISVLPHMADVGKMATEQVQAQHEQVDPNEPYGAIKHLLKLLPMLGVMSGGVAADVERGGEVLGAGPIRRGGRTPEVPPEPTVRSADVSPTGALPEEPLAPTSLDEVVAPASTPGAGAGADGMGDIADPSPGGRPADPVKGGDLAPAPPPPFRAPPKPKFKPVKFKGKLLSEWTDKDFEAYGKQFGVDNLGPESPPHMIKDMDGNEFNIPGGLEGNFTYYDLLKLKSQAINADRLEPALHTELAAKLGRTMTPANLTVEQIFNGMLFGLTSPNQPLLPNQMAASRLKVGSMADIERLADMIPWQVGDQVDKKLRKRHDTAIAKAFGVQAQEKGGLGIKGSQDYTRAAEMAQLFRKNPEWFRLRDGEAWPDLVDRISSQVTGLGTKTGSFSSVWQNPAGAQVSAMDRHMAMRFFEDMFPAGTAERAAIEQEMAGRWNGHIDRREALEKKLADNKINKKKYDQESGNIAVTSDATRAKDLKDILAQPAGDGFFTDVMLQKMGAGEKKLNVREGTGPNSYLRRNPRLSQGLQDTDWIVEPDKVKTASPLYRQALEVNAADAAQQGLSLFLSQWRGWDRQRRRLEPHENMFPGLEKLPRVSNDQLRAVLDAHRATGHLDYTKENLPNAKGENEARLRPTRATDNPASLAFFSQAPVPKGSQEDPAVQAAVQAWLRRQGHL